MDDNLDFLMNNLEYYDYDADETQTEDEADAEGEFDILDDNGEYEDDDELEPYDPDEEDPDEIAEDDDIIDGIEAEIEEEDTISAHDADDSELVETIVTPIENALTGEELFNAIADALESLSRAFLKSCQIRVLSSDEFDALPDEDKQAPVPDDDDDDGETSIDPDNPLPIDTSVKKSTLYFIYDG